MVRLRPALPAELARFTTFEQDEDAAPFVNTYPPEEHARMQARDDVTYLSIEHGGELDGFVLLVLDPDGRSVELRRIVVVEKDRGTGQAALAAAERYCADVLGRRRIWLDVAPCNARAKHIYEKLGYVPFAAPPGADGEIEFLEKSIVP
ncbi:MAG: GNAT family N-acetyltransferase [Planctomycetota bacterium]|jgi:RimJ/RimL family protein N-acetyltransferase